MKYIYLENLLYFYDFKSSLEKNLYNLFGFTDFEDTKLSREVFTANYYPHIYRKLFLNILHLMEYNINYIRFGFDFFRIFRNWSIILRYIG